VAAPIHSINQQVAARLGSDARNAGTRVLTVDTTVRSLVLSGGGWRLWGAATQVYYTTRACDESGVLLAGEVAPGTTDLAAAAAGSAAAAAAWDPAATVTALRAPTDTTLFAELAVQTQRFCRLYVRVAASTAAPVLEGPFVDPRPTET
jgi:hypothetical protein